MNHPTVDTFLNDVREHSMEVKHADGLYRHLRFKAKRDSWNMWFDVVTWPGFLTISGDMGCWTFARVEDMFSFFRSQDGLSINASYWSEKLQHGNHGGSDGAMVKDDDLFRERLLAQLTDYYGLDEADLHEVTAALKDNVLCNDGFELRTAAYNFKHRMEGGTLFQFDELPSDSDYSYHFIWCLYAIVWGIQRWDEAVAVGGDSPLVVTLSVK